MSDPNPEIIILTGADAPAFREIRLRGLREYPWAFGDDAVTFAARPMSFVADRIESARLGGGGVFAARDRGGGGMMGVVGVTPDAQLTSRHRAFLWGMIVLPEFQNRRIGRALVSHALSHCRDGGQIEQVRLGVATTNEPAIRLYRAMGFRQYGIEPRAIRTGGRDYDEYLMVCELREPASQTPPVSG